jgi:hypothetical protein
MSDTSLEGVERLTRDLRDAARTLSANEARFLVDAYYAMQEDRIRANAQVRSMGEAGEPTNVLSWLSDQRATLEAQVKRALDAYSGAHPVGKWARSIVGIGPVISAGLLAHIDIRKAPTAGHIWRYAGLDPTVRWNKGQKRPWNASLKTLCWKIGESFVKVSANENDHYGKVYRERKDAETAANDAGAFAEQAAAILRNRTFRKDTEAYKAYSTGRLPPAHIHARARRYAVKLFLSHLHHVWYETEFGRLPPRPYIIEHGGHTHFLSPPNWPTVKEPTAA